MLKGHVLQCEALEIRQLGKRIQYTCVAATRSHIALGTSTGSLYVYNQSDLRFVRVLAIGDGASCGSVSFVRFRYSPANQVVRVVNCETAPQTRTF